ncbi:MAG: TatD family hydrolase [Salinisphaeraceae bacterium]|nr:TatD family hydrolase [Salinisphaeraceae bacterium]
MPSIDIGANLAHDSFDADREAVLQRAKDAGVQAIVVTGSCAQSIPAAIALSREHAGYLYATAGVHPHHAETVNGELITQLQHWAEAEEIVAMGEMGLDFFRDFCPRDVQEKAFQQQLEIAGRIGKPLFLHQRDAHERFLPILREQLDHFPAAVVHCFTGTESELRDYLDLGLYIGITGWICDERRGQHLLDIVGLIPEDRLLVETDAPYLLPRNLKPKPKTRRNEPMYLPAVVETIATATGRKLDDVASTTADNAVRFFNLPSCIATSRAATG